MGFKIKVKNPVKSIGKALSSGFKSITKDPLGALTLGGWGTNALLKGLTGRTANLTQAGLYGAAGFLLGGPVGAGIGAGYSLASQGSLGTGLQDLATMGASAQMRANQRLADIYNRAQQEQAKAAEEENRRSLLQQIRATRIARAMNLADYASETGVTSSGALGNLGSIGSQYLSNTEFAVRQAGYQNAYQTYMNLYNQYQAKAQNSQIKWNNYRNLASLALYSWGKGVTNSIGEPLPSYSGIDFSISPEG